MSCLAWNPKNRDVLATGSSDGTARLWDFLAGSDGHALNLTKKPSAINHKSIESSKKNVTAVCWHPDGTVLATGRSPSMSTADKKVRKTVSDDSSPLLVSCKELCHMVEALSTPSNSLHLDHPSSPPKTTSPSVYGSSTTPTNKPWHDLSTPTRRR